VNRLRIAFAIIGFALAIISVALEDVRLGWAAIAVLLLSLLVRLVLQKRTGASPPDGGL
jgi:hypothetical protein